MSKPNRYTFEDLTTVLKVPLVGLMLNQPYTINSTDFDVPHLIGHSTDFMTIYIARILPHWPYLGRNIPIKGFLLMREQFARALDMAFSTTPPGVTEAWVKQEREILCIGMRMTDPDDNRVASIAEYARTCEEHAVNSVSGPSGIESYHKWLSELYIPQDSLPPDLALVV